MNLDTLRRMSGAERLAIASEMTRLRRLEVQARLCRYRPHLTEERPRAMRIHHANRKTAREIEIGRRCRRRLEGLG